MEKVKANTPTAENYILFGQDKGKGKGKGKSKGRYAGRPSYLSLEDRRWRLRELKAKTECRACLREGLWAHDRECAMSPSSSSLQNQSRTARMTILQRLSNQTKQIDVYFVLNDYSDDPDTSAFVVGQDVPLPKESARQTPFASDASTAVDTKKGFSTFTPWMTTMNSG